MSIISRQGKFSRKHVLLKNNFSYGIGDACGLPAGAAGVSDVSVFAAGAAVLAGVAVVVVGDAAGCCGVSVTGDSGVDSNTERLVPTPSERVNAISMNAAAAPIVILASRVCVPRGPNAVLDTELVKSAPASALPGCKSTARIITKHASTNRPYKK